MSRVGKNPVTIPSGVEVMINNREISAKGKNGQLTFEVPTLIDFKHEDNAITFTPRNNTKEARALWGTARARTQNIVTGVSEGYERKLEIHGVGYRAAVQGTKLNLSVGYSHPVNMDIPQGVTAVVEGNVITLTGADKHVLGQFAANVRATRKPEPYKGKGIRYMGEYIMMKEGKKK